MVSRRWLEKSLSFLKGIKPVAVYLIAKKKEAPCDASLQPDTKITSLFKTSELGKFISTAFIFGDTMDIQ